MDYQSYLNSLRGKRIGVIGFGVSNQPLVEALLKNGCDVTICDKREMDSLGEPGRSAAEKGAKFCLGEEYLEHLDFDLIFRTPGVLPIVPQLKAAADRGAAFTSEMEAFCALCPCKIIAITGSDGKTTTSTVISELLKTAGKTVHLGGNIGTPLFTRLPEIQKEDYAVLELSSFQLHSMKCSPDVAVITNVAPNHLDVHPDFQDYVRAKQNIYRGQKEGAVLVLNQKDPHTPEFYLDAPGQVRLFSSVGPVENGVFVENDVIYWARHGERTPIIHASDIRIPGAHNVENYMAAFAALEGLISNEDCVAVAKTFSGVPHRMELVREVSGVRFYNDSIASSPSRTIAGLHAWPAPPIILLGGHDKHIPFDELGDEVCLRAKAVVLCGETAQRIREAILKSKHYDPEKLPVVEKDDFREAIETAYSMAQPGDLVALSPACSSFDKFKNFAERGNIFRSIVESLPEK
jgi:UDP-N-acetylmuramoylalanine--D-glutamate ligase